MPYNPLPVVKSTRSFVCYFAPNEARRKRGRGAREGTAGRELGVKVARREEGNVFCLSIRSVSTTHSFGDDATSYVYKEFAAYADTLSKATPRHLASAGFVFAHIVEPNVSWHLHGVLGREVKGHLLRRLCRCGVD